MKTVLVIGAIAISAVSHGGFVMITDESLLPIQITHVEGSTPLRFVGPHPAGGQFYQNDIATAYVGQQGIDFNGAFAAGETIYLNFDGSAQLGGPFSNEANNRTVRLAGYGIQLQTLSHQTFDVQFDVLSNTTQTWHSFLFQGLPSTDAADDSAPFIGIMTDDGSSDILNVSIRPFAAGTSSNLEGAYSGPRALNPVPEPTALATLLLFSPLLKRRR